jgi:hypothetical protein
MILSPQVIAEWWNSITPTDGGVLWPDGSITPTPSYMRKSQSDWTAEEAAQCAADQQKALSFQHTSTGGE